LLGALAIRPVIDVYTGYDPNLDLKRGHTAMIAAHATTQRAVIHYEPFETAQVDGMYDFVFTSPPFFDLEDYKGGVQSIKTFPTFESWMNGFLFVMIDNAMEHLVSGGIFALYMSDYKGVGRHGKTLGMTERACLRLAKWGSPIGEPYGISGGKHIFPLWLYKKY
jgi:hypothetical protein